ncbi:hypothetical protein F4779DRAFT_498192 [Xylariaceae sp. FL0662B]|nr:hypothetical protein F4779DRAFT_498192 [Xylariaceae sp. FL0662B]
MSRLSPFPTEPHRSHSPASVAESDSSYHSFHNIELYEPAPAKIAVMDKQMPVVKEDKFDPEPIRRHDSGYESIHSGSRSGASQLSRRRNSAMSTNSSQTRPRTRPSGKRGGRSTPSSHTRRLSGQALHTTPSQQQVSTYYCFPPPETISDDGSNEPEPSYPPPPQTTHYWTSDHTRRLEYAAIDAASQGVKGWIMKHIIPDCFVPKASQRLTFDDDSGSVRRYRLELDCEETTAEKDNSSSGGKKMGWLLGR